MRNFGTPSSVNGSKGNLNAEHRPPAEAHIGSITPFYVPRAILVLHGSSVATEDTRLNLLVIESAPIAESMI